MADYCTTLQIARASGLGTEVFNELVGTGTGAQANFALVNQLVLASSYTLKYAASGSYSFTNLTDSTHYALNKDAGTIVLTAAGITALGTSLLYADYVYSPRQSETVMNSYLAQATAEVDKLTGNYWGTSKTSIDYFDGYDSGYPQTDEPYGYQIEPYPEFSLKYKSVLTITSVEFLDRQGNTDRTLAATEYRIFVGNEDQESRLLINSTIPNGKANIKVTYTHGYTAVPALVQELAALIGGLIALVNISGGSYKDISSYTFPEGSISIGQVYVNIRESIQQMQARIDSILNLLGSNYACV